MKIPQAALWALLVLPATTWAFVPTSPVRLSTRNNMATKAAEPTTDLTIPYDAAARLAYDEWRAKYKKGDFDQTRYEQFKANYEQITVANVSAKKTAREKGTDTGGLMTMNEYGDFSEEEYRQMMEGDSKISTGDVLGKAMDAAKSQEEASSALKDAANALAEEEEVGAPSADEYVIRLQRLTRALCC